MIEVSKIESKTNATVRNSWYANLLKYINNTSILLFDKEWQIRQFILIMITSNDDIIPKKLANENPEKYGLQDKSKDLDFSMLKINSGKIILNSDLTIYSKLFEYFIVVVILLS